MSGSHWRLLILADNSIWSIEWVVIGNISFWWLWPTTLVNHWCRCVLNLLFFSASKVFTTTVFRVLVILKEVLLRSVSLIFSALPSILCIWLLEEVLPTISNVTVGCCLTSCPSKVGHIQLWLIEEFDTSISLPSFEVLWSTHLRHLLVQPVLLSGVNWSVVGGDISSEGFVLLEELLLSASSRCVIRFPVKLSSFTSEELLSCALSFSWSTIILWDGCFCQLLIPLFWA